MGVSQALSFSGLLSVTVATPSVTSVRTARSFVFGMRLGLRHRGIAARRPRLRAAREVCQRRGGEGGPSIVQRPMLESGEDWRGLSVPGDRHSSNSLQSFSSGMMPPAKREIEKASIGVCDVPVTTRSATTAPRRAPAENRGRRSRRRGGAPASCRSIRSPATYRAGILQRPTTRGPCAWTRGRARPQQGGRGRAQRGPAERSPCRWRDRPSPVGRSRPPPGRLGRVAEAKCHRRHVARGRSRRFAAPARRAAGRRRTSAPAHPAVVQSPRPTRRRR